MKPKSPHKKKTVAADDVPGDRLPFTELTAYGIGGLPYSTGIEALKTLANPVFNILLGVNPALIGAILMASRVWDAVLDPLMGFVSDNTRSRFGRRKPYILLGSILSAVTFALIWFVPRDASPAFAAGWLVVTGFAFYAAFTVFCVPYLTLAFELTPSYSERTRITGARTFFSAISIVIISWALSAAHIDLFGDPLEGIRIVGIALSLLFIIGAVPSVIFNKERYKKIADQQAKLKFWPSFISVIVNKDFRILMGMTAILVIGTQTFNALGIYVNTYHVYDGNLKDASYLFGLNATINLFATWLCVPIVVGLAKRYGKNAVLNAAMIIGIAGSIGRWWLFDPRWPYAQLFLPILFVPAGTGFWIIVNSMKADLCDADELDTGVRREGLYAAVSSWVQKFAAALTFSISGLILVLVGFDQSRGDAQTSESILGMRIAFAFAPVLIYVLGIWMMRYYTLTQSRMQVIRETLESRRSAV